MSRLQRLSVTALVVLLGLVGLPETGFADRAWIGAWEPVVVSDIIVVGTLGDVEEVDEEAQRRICPLVAQRVLAGGVEPSDTLLVYWRYETGPRRPDDAMLRLSPFIGKHAVWLLACCTDGLVHAVARPLLLGPDTLPKLERLLESQRFPHDDAESGKKIDPVAHYLAGYVDAMARQDSAAGELRRSN